MTRGEVTGTEPQMMDAISGHEKNKVERRRQVNQIFVNLNYGRQQVLTSSPPYPITHVAHPNSIPSLPQTLFR